MIVNQKELVLVSYPFSNLEGNKVRPALVISNNFLNQKSADCIVIPLTTIIKDEPYSVIISQKDLSEGKLLQSSRARTDKVFCVEKRLILMKIGTVNDSVFNMIKKELLQVF